MESQTMFLDCPAYLDAQGTVRCDLPAAVKHRFTMRSTDGLLESVTIRCPDGHIFHAPVELLSLAQEELSTLPPVRLLYACFASGHIAAG